MKRLPWVVALVLGITGLAGAAPAVAGQGTDDVAIVPLGWGANGPAADRFSMPLFDETSIVPGDSGTQTVAVRNDGPVDGVLTASIVNVELGGDPRNRFYDELLLNGEPVSGYQNGKTAVLRTALDRGESTTVDLAYQFPEDSVSGNDPNARMSVSFDIALQLRETTGSKDEGEKPTAGDEWETPAYEDEAETPTSDNEAPGRMMEQGGQETAVAGGESDNNGGVRGSDNGRSDDVGSSKVSSSDDDGSSDLAASEDDGLAYTGTDLVWVVGAGLGLALLGGLMILVRRRSEETTS